MVQASRAWLETALTSVRTALTAAALTLLLGLGAISMIAEQPAPPAAQLGLSSKALDRILQAHRCSVTGFEPEVIPRTAVIIDRSGRTRLVSFDHGWEVFTRERPGELVAVCLDRRRPRGQP